MWIDNNILNGQSYSKLLCMAFHIFHIIFLGRCDLKGFVMCCYDLDILLGPRGLDDTSPPVNTLGNV